jgi:parvulin-like peptidyl-prolyl isomerase
MLKYFTLMISLMLVVSLAQQSDADDPVVLRVNSDAVRLSSFNDRFNFYIASIAAQQGFPLTEEIRPLFEQLRPSYLEQLINERVVLQLARQRGIRVSEDGIDQQLEDIRQSFENEAQYEAALVEAGITSEAFLRELLIEAAATQQIVTLLRSEIVVPDYMVSNFYAANPQFFQTDEQTCARHILVETEALARELALELDGGAAFETLASDYSIDTGSAARGGDLGCFPRGVMIEPFEAAAFGGALGVVSDPVETQFGYHLVLPYDRLEAEVVPLEEVRADIEAELTQEILQNVIQGYRDAAVIETFPELLTPADEATDTEGGN